MDGPAKRFLSASPFPRRGPPIFIVWVFVAIVVLLLGLTVYSSQLLAAGRALVAAESTWSRAQKDAVFSLSRYAVDRDEEDWRRYESAMRILAGDREARQELLKRSPDRERVQEALMRAGIHPSDVDGIWILYRHLRGLGPLEYVTALWARSDLLAEELGHIGRRLRGAGARIPPEESVRSTVQINRINGQLVPLEREFAQTLGDIQRTAESLLTSGILIIAGLLLVGGIMLSRRFLAQGERLQQALAESESQLRQLVESAPLPLLIARSVDGALIYANGRALEQFALPSRDALRHTLPEFHAEAQEAQALAQALRERGSVRDFEVRMKDMNGAVYWLLLSAQPIEFAGEECLLVALADIDDRKRMQDDMRRKAMHDQLTGLPNRAMFMESLERAMHKSRRRASRFSVLFIDLDRFKEVNDTMGHHAGDVLLQAVAGRLGAAVRQSDLVARMGGDEFVVLIEEHGGPEEVMIVAQKVLAMLERPVRVDWREAAISGSIGIASFPEDGADLETLVRNADTAMYQAKERGRNNFRFYSEELNRISHRRVEQEKRLREALGRDEFLLEYLPEIDTATGRMAVVEALARWRDPVAGIVGPQEFMPLAEETGTAAAIGAWVLDRALRDMREWQRLDPGLKLAMNVSPRQLQQHDLPEAIGRALREHDVPPARLRIEITETALMQDFDAAHRTLRSLKALGVELAIDDFGTGYSSLGLVRGLPIDVVKIDRSLVSTCPVRKECAAIVQAASAMSRVLGIRVVAEGVETDEQRALVAQLGCDGLQGYLVSAPVSAADIAARIRAVAEQTFFA